MKISTIILILFMLTIYSCKQEKTELTKSKFDRKWYSLNSHLTINPNKTFEFVRYTSVSQSIAKGKWKNINDTLILNSIRPNGCFFEESFLIMPPDSTRHLKTSIKDCHPNTGIVNFKDEKFYLQDTLLISKSSPKTYNGELSQIYNFRMTSYYK